PAVVPWLDHLRVQLQPVALLGPLQLDLVHVEAELVQPMQALAQPELLVRREDLLRRQLGPEPAVAKADLVGDLERIAVADAAELLLEVVQLTDEILLRDLEIVQALAVRQLLVPFRRLRVDEIRRERTRVAAAPRVRARA